ncbi:MAG: M1 family metallopeptidase [Burkholderiales bacterium]|nr:M1 family metallopeptidase [Burkholderiales bacterium]
MTRWLMAALLAWVVSLAPHAMAQTGWRVQHYALQLEPHFETRSFTGALAMDFTVKDSTLQHLDLDAGDLQVARVQLGTADKRFERHAQKLRVFFPQGLATGTPLQLRVAYEGKASSGLRFDTDTQQVATVFSTSLWMPCLDDPSVRASFALALILPNGMLSVGNGERVGELTPNGDLLRHRWRLDTPMPSYLYGFAAGRFAQANQMAGVTTLEYFGPVPFTAQTLPQVFADTADMLAFYADKAGVAYPLPAYRQVLLVGPAAQEMAGFSVMGARYGTRVLANPQSIWLGAHEAAHQWWGNGVTNRSWRHFWLNEGIATFMTAAYLEHRFGAQEYRDQIEAARTNYTALRDAGLDRSLVFPDWDAPTAADRSLVYDKGALVLHELRAQMGEALFWKGLRHYTRTHWGQSVETADFQRAMESASGLNLQAFFKRWVYLQSE